MKATLDWFKQELTEIDSIQASLQSWDEILQERLNKSIAKMMGHCEILENEIGESTDEIKHLKLEFRQSIAPWYSQSYLMDRALTKPRGYPGDFELLEAIYNNQPLSKGIGYYIDYFFLTTPLAKAVRCRKDFIREKLSAILSQDSGDLRILNLASGPCREWSELLPDLKNPNLHLTCIDNDQESLEWSRKKLINGSKIPEINFVNYDLVRWSLHKNIQELHPMQHVIYSMGLYDYLPDNIFNKLIRTQLEIIEKGGVIIIPLKDQEKYDKTYYDWMTDWKFIPRTEKSFLDFLGKENLNFEKVTIERDSSGIMIFFELKI